MSIDKNGFETILSQPQCVDLMLVNLGQGDYILTDIALNKYLGPYSQPEINQTSIAIRAGIITAFHNSPWQWGMITHLHPDFNFN